MYVAPDGIIKILKSVPLDPSFDHTLYWSDTTTQYNYFSSFVKPNTAIPNTLDVASFTLDKQSYQRVQRGYIQVGIVSDLLYDCNYLMFQNTNFGARWFYAFIKSVEYVNNNCSRIEFEIDVMQTWFFDYHVEDCFVEREHSVTDNIGDNTVPENLEIGEYVYHSEGKLWGGIDAWAIVIAAPFEIKQIEDPISGQIIWSWAAKAQPGFYNKYFSGLHYSVIEISSDVDIQNLYILISNLEEKEKNEIVAIYMMPLNITSEKSVLPQISPTSINRSINKNIDWSYGEINRFNNGKYVRNNKLYTYPFNCLYITSSDGGSSEYKYELFPTTTCDFTCEAVMGVPPEAQLVPAGYSFYDALAAAPVVGPALNYNFSLPLKNFPVCSWTTDAFLAWLAQASNSLNLSTTMLGVTMLAPELAPLTIPAAIGSTMGSIMQMPKAMLQPNCNKGANRNTVSIANNEFGYHFYNARVKDEYARMFDEYFNKFGYATKRTKQPNRSSRPCWNYVKTIGCTITGSIPGDDAKKICSLYDTGITFWHTTRTIPGGGTANVTIGDYSQDNSPV